MKVIMRSVGSWPMNTYVLVCPQTHHSILIDPGAEPDTLAMMLEHTHPVAIVLTHTHPDHVGALETMRERLNVPVWGHGGPHFQNANIKVDQVFADGERFAVGESTLFAHYAPGHINDMICYVAETEPLAIVGDTVFAGGPGKTWSAADFKTTLETLKNVVLQWSNDTMCYPGHGPSFRLGDLRPEIEAFVARDHPADFYGDAEWAAR